jgi:putative glutamine amidotransferase
MKRARIGIIGNHYLIEDRFSVHAGGTMNSEAIADAAGCMPLLVPSDPRGRPNVHPENYGEAETEAHGAFDRARDAITLPLVRACVERGQPVLGVCRGFQEMNVALGGSLHPEIRDLPGRDNHRMPPNGTLEEQFALRHIVRFAEGGVFHRLMGAQEVMTNTLHGQGVKQPGARIRIDGHAPDGTPEALYVADAPGFALGVQWHPEWRAATDPVSRPLFGAFGEAARAWAAGHRACAAALKSA